MPFRLRVVLFALKLNCHSFTLASMNTDSFRFFTSHENYICADFWKCAFSLCSCVTINYLFFFLFQDKIYTGNACQKKKKEST